MDDPSPERVHAAEALLRPAGIDPVILGRPKELCGHSARNVATGPGFKGLVGGLVLGWLGFRKRPAHRLQPLGRSPTRHGRGPAAPRRLRPSSRRWYRR